jgi:hypothetical protein
VTRDKSQVSVGGLFSLKQVLRKPWSGLERFWTTTGWSKMKCPGKDEIMNLTCFMGYVDPTRGSLQFL